MEGGRGGLDYQAITPTMVEREMPAGVREVLIVPFFLKNGHCVMASSSECVLL